MAGDNKLTFNPPTPLPELTQNLIRSSHGHSTPSTPSLKISCNSVHPFSRNVADKERKKRKKKEREKERKKSLENNTPSPYRGRDKNDSYIVDKAITYFITFTCNRIMAFLQGVSIACYTELCISYGRVVRLSIRMFVTRWHWVKTAQARITKSSPTDSSRNLVLVDKKLNSKGFTPSEGVKCD